MGKAIEETYWTAKEWALRTRIPYRTILTAVARGELAAVRPSGTQHGCIHISESSWATWMRESAMRVRIPGRLDLPGRTGDSRTLADLALG